MYRGCCLEQSMVMALCRLDVVAVDSASRDDETVRVVPFDEVCIDLHFHHQIPSIYSHCDCTRMSA